MVLDWTVIIVAVLGALSGLGSLAIQWSREKHEGANLNADSETKLSRAALDLLEPMQKRIDELEEARERDKLRLSEHERRITELECELRAERTEKEEVIAGAKRLYRQIESMDGKPVYRPPGIPGTGELKAK